MRTYYPGHVGFTTILVENDSRARFNDDRGIVPNTESLPRYVGATRRNNNNFIPCYYYRINRVYLHGDKRGRRVKYFETF